MQDFKKLIVWQKSHQLALEIYRVTRTFPKDEIYGITSQIRRASVSVPSNIAEGCGREGAIEFNRFCQIAMGSVYELEYQILLAYDLKLIDNQNYENLNNRIGEIRKMLQSFVLKLKDKNNKKSSTEFTVPSEKKTVTRNS